MENSTKLNCQYPYVKFDWNITPFISWYVLSRVMCMAFEAKIFTAYYFPRKWALNYIK